MRALFATLLVLEGLFTALRTAMRSSVLFVYPAPTVALVALRFFVAVQQFATGWMVRNRRPAGPLFARWVFAESAVLTTFEIGFSFAPSSLFPAYRWWAVGLYWIYALVGIVVFRPERRR